MANRGPNSVMLLLYLAKMKAHRHVVSLETCTGTCMSPALLLRIAILGGAEGTLTKPKDGRRDC